MFDACETFPRHQFIYFVIINFRDAYWKNLECIFPFFSQDEHRKIFKRTKSERRLENTERFHRRRTNETLKRECAYGGRIRKMLDNSSFCCAALHHTNTNNFRFAISFAFFFLSVFSLYTRITNKKERKKISSRYTCRKENWRTERQDQKGFSFVRLYTLLPFFMHCLDSRPRRNIEKCNAKLRRW